VKYLILICSICLLFSCSEKTDQEQESVYWAYHPQNQQANWDQQAFILLSDYLNIQNSFKITDTTTIKTAVQNLLSTTDTIIAHTNGVDSLTQSVWMPGLQNFRNELEAFVLEQDTTQIKDQLKMCTVTLVNFLGDIGYKKTNIYVFQKMDEINDWFWIGNEKTSKNPFDAEDRKEYNANFTLQEP
jgi:hypothetical protein